MIRPGKMTCAGLVAIMMVLPNSVWKSGSARANAGPTRGSRAWDPHVRVVRLPKRALPRVSDVPGMDRRK